MIQRRQKKPVSPEAMRLRLAGLCSRIEQCSHDLRRKILNAGLSATQAEEILLFLREGKFLDDTRFARAYASDKARFSGWGVLKIRGGLMAKQIPADIIEAALGSIDRREYIEAFKRAASAKARSLDLSLPEDAARLYRHLASRGYEPALISKAVSSLRSRLRGK